MLPAIDLNLSKQCLKNLWKEGKAGEKFVHRNLDLKKLNDEDCDYIDILFHPVEWNCWKSSAIKVIGSLFGVPTRWVHCSLRVSMNLGQGDRHEVIYDYTDEGVISYTQPIHDITGIVRLYVEPTAEGCLYIQSILDRIDDMHSSYPVLDWWQAIPILKRQEPNKLVCTSFVTHVLALGSHYRTPQSLYSELVNIEDDYKLPEEIVKLVYWEI